MIFFALLNSNSVESFNTNTSLIIGFGHGGLVADLASVPLLLEQACRYRIVGMEGMARYRMVWAKALAIVAINPELMPQ